MNIISKEELQNRENPTIRYKLDNNVLRSNIMSVLSAFQSEKISFLSCECDTFDKDDNSLRVYFNNLADMSELINYPNPYMSFEADYVDLQTGKYVYTIKTEVNMDRMDCVFDKKKQAEITNSNSRGIGR